MTWSMPWFQANNQPNTEQIWLIQKFVHLNRKSFFSSMGEWYTNGHTQSINLDQSGNHLYSQSLYCNHQEASVRYKYRWPKTDWFFWCKYRHFPIKMQINIQICVLSNNCKAINARNKKNLRNKILYPWSHGLNLIALTLIV